MTNRSFLAYLILLSSSVFAYQWPMKDASGNVDNVKVTSNFCDYRPQYNSVQSHFHEGIDIPEESGADVRAKDI